jgi:hypothetical protein
MTPPEASVLCELLFSLRETHSEVYFMSIASLRIFVPVLAARVPGEHVSTVSASSSFLLERGSCVDMPHVY